MSLGLFGMVLPLLPATAQGAVQIENTTIEETPTPSDSAGNNELLLFWEEKELYVESATRVEKPLDETAENISVVTAKDIEQMNAHTVAEVLKRVPGLFVDTLVQDFGSLSSISIQGSEPRHVLVLLDGVIWNFLGEGTAETSTIPVRIIDRIEIVKGPASSAWGSALGGVVNIITKSSGDTTMPKGALSVSYGEKNSQDYGAELSGKGGPVGYYLQAGRQKSAGLRKNRAFDNDSLYGKLSIAPNRDLNLQFTIGYSDPQEESGDLVIPRIAVRAKTRLSALHATGNIDYRLAPEWAVKGSAYALRQRFDNTNYFITPSALYKELVNEERTVGGGLRLTYSGASQSAVVGVDASRGITDQTNIYGPFLQGRGAPASESFSPSITKWALFANDTLSYGRLAVTPGVRLDHNNVSGYFFSPSLGLAYELGERTVARASVARGFTSPPLGWTSIGGIFTTPNPSLGAERVWSYQVGLESGVTDYLNLKGTLFRHDMTDEISTDVTPPANIGSVTRQGFELEAETAPFHNLTLRAAHAYVNIDRHSDPEALVQYSYQTGIKYDDRQSFMAHLSGTYIWWNLPASRLAKYNTFIWDANLSKRFSVAGTTGTELFLTVHNLFASSNYTMAVYPNPGRWFEGGVRVRF
ncbi:TonB-dependent receptor [Geobacter argillaceus]|uniref:Vitamin B12 transporter n=1 Tax=Geobacter argillaceus TaxID=345631 RepID=A0A562V6Y1_9BACT|nr:TonB-dependent receptor [Geobacter argillaceus]TWJ13656.1 vitamin B12 transporter [Geobacter argillaceus]